MSTRSRVRLAWPLQLPSVVLLALLLVPLGVLLLSSSTTLWTRSLSSAEFAAALRLSLWTTTLSTALAAALGTPLAWWLSRTHSTKAFVVELVVELPIIVPPAVVGVALLTTFGPQAMLGQWLTRFDVVLPFSTTAVVLAQVTVATPFFVQAAANAFRQVPDDVLDVAMTLGASPSEALWRVALPTALPGLVVGVSLAWARALGEFGATLLFAGNQPGRTQTLPLAIFSTLEQDVDRAVVFAAALALVGIALLLALRLLPRFWPRRRGPP